MHTPRVIIRGTYSCKAAGVVGLHTCFYWSQSL